MTDREFEARLLAAQAELFIYARKLTRHRERAEDALQDANVKIWQRRSLYVKDDNFLGWCKTILRNNYLNQVAKESHMLMVSDNRFVNGDDLGSDESRFGSVSTKAQYWEAKFGSMPADQEDYWLENRIMEAIATLEPHTALLITKKLQGMTYEQIAKPLGIKANNAKQRYFNDIKTLRQKLLELGLVEDK